MVQGADASCTNDRNQTPLYQAVENEHTAASDALCAASPSAVNTADEWGLSPLHIAAKAGDVGTVAVLLSHQVWQSSLAYQTRPA